MGNGGWNGHVLRAIQRSGGFSCVRDALRESNFSGFAVVEQDMYPAPFDKPLPLGKRNRDYLRQIGIG